MTSSDLTAKMGPEMLDRGRLASACIVCLVVITTRAADPIVTKVTRPDTTPTRTVDNSTTLTPSLFHTIRFKSGVCRHGKHDVTLYGKTAKDCINECRKRTLCTAVNMYLNVGECRFNFEDELPEMDCPKFLYSAKESWAKKWEPGCEFLNCSLTETCLEMNGSHTCVTTECTDLPPLHNGQVLGNRVEVGVAKGFSCNDGYKINGRWSTTCLPDGSWDRDVPVCSDVSVDCSIPPDVQNGTVKYHPHQSLLGDTANVTCNTGFNMSGNSVITCQSNGTWTNMPVCNYNSLPINCSTPPDVQNVTVDYNPHQTLLGDTAYVTCNVGFNMSGNSVITCQRTGTWSEMPVCTFYRRYGDVCVDTCSESVHECRKNVCSCVFGMYFDPNTNQCVKLCLSGFSRTSYQVHENTRLSDNFPALVTSTVPDTEACFNKCLDNWKCTTLVISRIPNQDAFKCDMFGAQLKLVYFSSRASEEGNTLYFRDCAETRG